MNDNKQAEKEAEDLIKWSEQLNYDRYIDEWYFKSTIFINFELQENNANSTSTGLGQHGPGHSTSNPNTISYGRTTQQKHSQYGGDSHY